MSSANDFIPSKYEHSLEKGAFSWSAPSNIALVSKILSASANWGVALMCTYCTSCTYVHLFGGPIHGLSNKFSMSWNLIMQRTA